MSELAATEYLYGIDSSVADDDRFYEPPRVIQFRITKKTPKRIYYATSEDWEKRTRVGFVNRQRIEADGEVYQRNRHWSAPDFHLYLNPPELEQVASSRPWQTHTRTVAVRMRRSSPPAPGTSERGTRRVGRRASDER